MNRYAKIVFLPLLTITFILVLSSYISASVFFGENRYVIPRGDTLDDDLYLGVNEALLGGVLTGDLVLAGANYTVTGDVLGNVSSFSQFATLRGSVDKSVRIFAYRVDIDGHIGRNLLAFGNDVELGRSSSVGRDIDIMGTDVSISGTVDGNAHIRGDQIVISGVIAGDVDIEGNRITILSPAEIMGDLTYKSKREINIDNDVVIAGEIEWVKIDKGEKKDEGINWFLRFILFLASLVTGLLIILLANRHTRVAAGQVIEKPMVSLGVGFVSFCAAPIGIIVLCLTLVGIPAGIMLLFAFSIFFYISKIYVAIALGRFGIRAFKKDANPKQGWSLLFGLIILTLLFTIPYAGQIIYFLTIFFGIGAILLGLKKCRAETTAASTPSPDLQSPV